MNNFKVLYFLILIIISFTQKGVSQIKEHHMWIFSEKAYIISDTLINHDTITCLSWADSVSYYSKYKYDLASRVFFDSTWWFRVVYKNVTGLIKYQDVTLEKKFLKCGNYYAFFQSSYGDGLRWWSHIVILNSNNELKNDFQHIGFDEGYWINQECFLFCNTQWIYKYSLSLNSLVRLDTARKFIWNKDLNKIICIYSSHSYPIKVKINSINIDGTEKNNLFSFCYRIEQLGIDEDDDDFIEFKIDRYKGHRCYSFLVTFTEGIAKVYVDWKGHHLTTKYNEI